MTGETQSGGVGPRDQGIIAGELGRTPRDLTGIAVRCPFGYPAVIETAPILTDGAPNPTLLYVSCPTLAAAISRVEAGGGVRKLKASCREDDELRELLLEITQLYRTRRAALVKEGWLGVPPGPRLGAGIGGPEGPETAACLHSYGAALLAVMAGWLNTGQPSGEGAVPGGKPADPELQSLAARAQEVWNRFLPPVEDCWCRDNRCARWDTGRRSAAIDIGTISVRLLVADVVGDRPHVLARRAEVTRLGEGLGRRGLLTETAKWRTAEVVARYASEARLMGADTIMLAGTSAARDAVDGEEFIDQLGRENDAVAAVLTGTAEAERAFSGVSVDIEGDPVVLDIGGGSTELMCRLDTGAVSAVSLEIGASRATDRWIKSDPPTERELAEVHEEAEAAFREAGSNFSAGGRNPVEGEKISERRLVGVAGTVTTLACLDADLQEYDPRVLHLRSLSLESVRRLVERLGALSVEERAALPCMQPGRAPVIVAGAVILLAAMETLGYDQLTVSERDLLDGLVLRGMPSESSSGWAVLT